ncbi:MAG: DUF4279 domain-containing protein [Pseudomonadota bacterium]
MIISVNLYGDSVPLDRVESILGLKADIIGKKGEHIKNNPKYAKYKTSTWCSKNFNSEEKGGIHKLLENICDKMRKNKSQIKALMNLEDIRGKVYISMSMYPTHGREEISFEQLAILAELKFNLCLDVL